jgi:hypothetical protein
MKPAVRSTGAAPPAKTGLAAALQRFLSGPAVSDPMYLTNQTFGQKAKRVLLVAAPILIVVLSVAGAMMYYAKKHAPPATALTSAEVGAKLLPDFHPDLNLDSNKNLDVLKVQFEHSGGNVMTGVFQNKTNHLINEAEVIIDLFDDSGSNLGGVKVTEANLAAGESRNFQRAIEQSNAEHAMVREVHTH